MKNSVKKLSVFIGFLFISNVSFAEQKINSNDPCTVFLCMSGKVMGSSSSECSAPERKFFSIISKKHGKFNGSRTSRARDGFLSQCKEADSSMVSKIISKFGSRR